MKRQLSLPMIVLSLYAASVCLNASFRHHLLPAKQGADIVERVFGNLRVFVGDWAFMKAEEYHHRGLPFEGALLYHEGESLSAEYRRREESREVHEAAAPLRGLYEKLYSQVKVTADSHLKPEEEKEVLPWFYVETAFNPHDIRGYALGGYWLTRIGRNDEAVKFLKGGEKNNPDSAQILGSMGEIYMKEGDEADALVCLERSRRLWLEGKGANKAMNKYEESDRLFAFDLLASLYARKADYAKALEIYTELLKFGPNPGISTKIETLKKRR